MKFYLFIVFLFFSSLVFADNSIDIQVMINGHVYQCFGDSSSNTCTTAAKAALSKFNACLNGGASGSYCFQASFQSKVVSCIEWSEACNNSCNRTAASGSYCFQSCYE